MSFQNRPTPHQTSATKLQVPSKPLPTPMFLFGEPKTGKGNSLVMASPLATFIVVTDSEIEACKKSFELIVRETLRACAEAETRGRDYHNFGTWL